MLYLVVFSFLFIYLFIFLGGGDKLYKYLEYNFFNTFQVGGSPLETLIYII